MHGKYSNIHQVIYNKGYIEIYKEYKISNVRIFCKKYNISASTANKIFGPKLSKSKKIMIKILKKEGEQGKIREIAEKYIL